jgi:hypothetical protein
MQQQPFDELLRTYKIRVKVILGMMDEDATTEDWKEVCRIKLACYRTFINELEEAMQS